MLDRRGYAIVPSLQSCPRSLVRDRSSLGGFKKMSGTFLCLSTYRPLTTETDRVFGNLNLPTSSAAIATLAECRVPSSPHALFPPGTGASHIFPTGDIRVCDHGLPRILFLQPSRLGCYSNTKHGTGKGPRRTHHAPGLRWGSLLEELVQSLTTDIIVPAEQQAQ